MHIVQGFGNESRRKVTIWKTGVDDRILLKRILKK